MANNDRCKWTYKVFSHKNPDTADAKKFINNLKQDQRLTYKIAQDDRRSENAHTVIFYDSNSMKPSAATGISNPVVAKQFKAKGKDSSDLEGACGDACHWLNSLEDYQGIGARVTLSNSKNPEERLTIYYPTE